MAASGKPGLDALFACQHDGVTPDIMSLGKGLSAGVPISALLARAQGVLLQPGLQALVRENRRQGLQLLDAAMATVLTKDLAAP